MAERELGWTAVRNLDDIVQNARLFQKDVMKTETP
ncbi:hypothetical protein BH23CHL7_BH23CHL7_06590 [soil metagenome]